MVFDARWLAPLAATLTALVGALALSMPLPDVPIREAALHEGQDVAVAGVAADVRTRSDATTFTLLDGTPERNAIAVRAASTRPDEERVVAGAWVHATGRLQRIAGVLTLVADGPDAIRPGPAPAVQTPTWDDLAAHPETLRRVPITLEGRIDHGALVAEGHRVRLGPGPWPASGPVRATGILDYDDACLCDTFQAATVWTP